MRDYTDPETARQVAEWVYDGPGHTRWRWYGEEPSTWEEDVLTYRPWSSDAPRTQLTSLLEAIYETGLWEQFVRELAGDYFIMDDHVIMYRSMIVDPKLVYESCVDVLRDEGEIE